MKYIIVIRMNNDELWAISDDNNINQITEFDSELEAEELMEGHILFQLDWEIIPIGV